MGLIFMAMAGYDPNTAPCFLGTYDELRAVGRHPRISVYSPSIRLAVAGSKSWMPEAMKYYKPMIYVENSSKADRPLLVVSAFFFPDMARKRCAATQHYSRTPEKARRRNEVSQPRLC